MNPVNNKIIHHLTNLQYHRAGDKLGAAFGGKSNYHGEIISGPNKKAWSLKWELRVLLERTFEADTFWYEDIHSKTKTRMNAQKQLQQIEDFGF